MRAIQPVLLVMLFLFAVLYLRKFRSELLDRIAIFSLLGCGTVFLLFPDLTNRIAHWFGVGRGADLLLYVAVFAMGFLMLTVFASQRRTQNDVTRLTRAIALQNVRIPDSATPPVLPAS